MSENRGSTLSPSRNQWSKIVNGKISIFKIPRYHQDVKDYEYVESFKLTDVKIWGLQRKKYKSSSEDLLKFNHVRSSYHSTAGISQYSKILAYHIENCNKTWARRCDFQPRLSYFYIEVSIFLGKSGSLSCTKEWYSTLTNWAYLLGIWRYEYHQKC